MKSIIAGCLAAMCMIPTLVHAEDKKFTIAGIVFQEDQFMKSTLMGMKSVADKNHVNLLTANTSNQISKEVQVVDTYTARKVDAIVITYLDPAAASIPAVKAANDKGIKIVSFNNTLAADFPVSTVQSDNLLLGGGSGKAAAEFIKKNYAGKKEIKVGIINYKAQLPPESNARQDGFWNEIKDIPGVTLVAEASSPVAEEAIKKATDILTAHPDLDLMYACNSGGTVGTVLAVKNAGKKVPVFGIDLDKQIVGFLQSNDNILQASTAQDPFKIGALAMENAIKALKNEPVEKKIIVPGLTLSRTDPAAVAAFAKTVK
ncbi:MAG: substrate-binding domain-containing protein [Azospirillaceae bacterium]|nr:substrate-binding domain-containing protein [Azospirillaceae bacterium]